MIRFLSFLAWSAFSLATFAHADGLQIWDVIPASLNSESDQNSEPSIAVNPARPREMAITAFGYFTSPIFLSTDSGSDWNVLQTINTADSTLDWSSSGAAYLANVNGYYYDRLVCSKLEKAGDNNLFTRVSTPYHSQYVPDQPWIRALKVDGHDHLYIGFNDLGLYYAAQGRGRTATIRFSLDGGVTWQRQVIENKRPKLFQDGSVRVTAIGNNVSAVFERFNAVAANNTLTSDIVLARDASAGLGNFTTLPPVTIAKNQPIPYGRLGDERLGSDLSIVMDPSNFAHLCVAFAVQPGSVPYLVVYESVNYGATWTQAWKAPDNTGLPALAMTQNGVLGMLYTAYVGGNLETHLMHTGDDFGTVSDTVLSRFVNGKPALEFDPYIGDYEDLMAVNNTFYGTFCASNNTKLFPIQPTFLRDASLLGKSVPYSIDPFFFKLTVDNPQSFNGN